MTRDLRRMLMSARGLNVILGALALLFLILWLIQLGADTGPGAAVPNPSDLDACLPSCGVPNSGKTDDGRMFLLVSGGLDTLLEDHMQFGISAAGKANSNAKIMIFDGDTNGVDSNNDTHWDLGGVGFTNPVYFVVCPDPTGSGVAFDPATNGCLLDDGSGSTQSVAPSHGPIDGNTMGNNEWFTMEFPQDDAAKAENGRYNYLLVAYWSQSGVGASAFKVGVTADSILFIHPGHPIAVDARVNSVADASIIWPNYTSGNYSPSNYDGSFTFYVDVTVDPGETGTTSFMVIDGDLDRDPDDTNDLNTPPFSDGEPGVPAGYSPFSACGVAPQELPFLAGTNYSTCFFPLAARGVVGNMATEYVAKAVYSGSSTAAAGVTGNPSDDRPNASSPIVFSPAVYYTVTSPDGTTWTNDNPSGNQEWEFFRISGDSQDSDTNNVLGPDIYQQTADDTLPAGIYTVKSFGNDMQNLNAWIFFDCVSAVRPDGTPVGCTPEERGGGEGCTPGYWKNNAENRNAREWVNYAPTDSYDTVFGVTSSYGSSYTLLDALGTDGGGEAALLRHSTAALLNVTSSVSYPYFESELIADVQAAFATQNFEPLKDLLDGYNNAGCPLSNRGGPN